MKPISWIMVFFIRIYQRVIGPCLPRVCRYHPSCSEYFAQALLIKGPIKGTLLGIWRIMRCHPLSPGGYDPVIRESPPERHA